MQGSSSNGSGETSKATPDEGNPFFNQTGGIVFLVFHLVIWISGLYGISISFFAAGVSSKETHVTGVYELVSVLTHKGRSADSGHYVAWVKQESGELSLMNSTYSS